MRLGAGNHRASVAAKAFTVAVMAVATLAQLSSIAHEMTVRHFRCAEHGELTHVATLAASSAAPATSPRAVPARRSLDALAAPETERADAHEHCGVAFTLEGSSCTPSVASAIGTVAPAPAVRPAPALMILGGRGVVLASAPKTSPPSA